MADLTGSYSFAYLGPLTVFRTDVDPLILAALRMLEASKTIGSINVVLTGILFTPSETGGSYLVASP